MNNETQTSRFRLGKKVASVFLSAAILATTFTGLGSVLATSGTMEVQAASSYGLATKVEDGNILHCFDWKLSDIKAELPHIAEAGFTSVQTSPLQGHNNTGTWYWLYQPLNFKVGNELGSYQDLQDLCTEADKYGIKVIVDVVANHLAGWNDGRRADAIDGSLNRDDFFHNQGGASNWNDRNEIIYKNIGMPDLASENEDLQNVILGMINSMKDAGVDGIRWDAAKHIGLPSEGCSFWAKMASTGLYNYGEILDNPAGNSGDDYNANLMKEYSNYIGITDANHSGEITGSIRDSKTTQSGGYWTNRGVPANRCVYWAESHDTYSNNPPPDEGGWTKYLSEDVIDRAYAVVAARANSQALYLSRPFEKNKDSITYGVKGSTHFTEKQIAEVNKFHNAMVGTNEYFTAAENCFVVCRGGGAVVVNASGGGKQVTVPNGGGLVPAGEYTDAISGSKWTVTSSTMSGSIGDTGIAVFYNGGTPGPIPQPGSVSASPSTGTFDSSISVTLSASGVSNAKYECSDGQSGSFTDGQKITIGANAGYGTVTLKLSGTKEDGSATSASYTYTKKDPDASVSVYVDNSVGNWSKVYAYVYKGAGGTGNQMAAWPGKEMTKSGDYYTLDVTGYEEGFAIFSDGSDSADKRYPADQQPGLSIGGSSKLFTMPNKWVDYVKPTPVPVPVPDVPTVNVDKASGTSFNTETLKITLSLANATKGTYCVDGGPVKEFTSTTAVEIGEGKIGDSTVTVETTATGSDGTKKSYTFKYDKKYVVKTSSSSAGLSSYYQTNGKGVGKEKTITIDGDASDWSEDMMIAQGAAWDVANHWKGAHENCLLDTYALFAAWDDSNLYIGCQMVNTTDTWQNPGDASLMDGAGVGNVPQILALSIDPSSPTMTNQEITTSKPIWSMGGVKFETHVDRLLYMSGQPGQGEPSMFAAADSQGNTDYTSATATVAFADGGIEYKMARTNICSNIYGLNNSDSPTDVTDDSADWVDYKTYQGSKGVHDTSIDTFYEIKIPLSTLGITKDYLTSNGIGAMWLATRGESPLDCIPFDPSMVDHVEDGYSADPSTSAEKEDLDVITVSLASIGNGTINPTPTPIPTPTPTPGTPLQVNFGTDKSAPQLNTTALTIKGIGMGGTAPYKYEFSVDGNVVQASSTTDSYTWKPGTSKKHTLKCVITDSTGAKATSEKTFTSEGTDSPTPVPTTLTNTSTISATSIALGKSVTMTGASTGGSGTKLYAGWYKLSTDSSYTTIRDYSTTSTFTVTPKKAGTYSFVIRVKDGAGANVRKEFSVRVTSTALTNTSTISATSIAIGKSVTMTGSCTGGSGTKQYAGWYKLSSDSAYTTIRDYSTTNTFTVTPKKVGTYSFVIRVKDGAGANSRKEFSVKVTAGLTNTSTISATSVALGKSVTMTGSCTGGSGTKQYAGWYKLSTDSSYTTIRDYSTTNTFTVTPKKAGTYSFVIRVKDGAGANARKEFSVKVTAGLTNTSKVSATSITLGSTVTVTASATGGTGTKKYAVYYKKSTASTWTTGHSYSTTTTIKVTPKHTGTYTIRVKVKDGTGTEVNKDFKVTVNSSTLANTSKVSATTISKGNSIKVTCSSTGGVGTKKYAVWYKKSTQSSYTQVKKYSTTTTATVTPKGTGKYYISVKVKDGNGNIKKKAFTITVKAALANTTTASATTITKGKGVKLTLASTGGVGTKKYAVWYKKSTASSWTQKQSYSTNTTVTVTPKSTGTYYISTKVKDANGTIVKKQFTITVKAALANTSKVSKTWLYKGESIKVTLASTGGVGTKKYAVWYKKSTQDSWTKIKDYTTGTTATVTPKGTGTYYISTKVKDANGTIVKKQFTVKSYTALSNTSTISSTSISKGKSVTLTCASTGGYGTKTYAVYYKPTSSSTWTKVRDYATGTKVTVTPKSATTYTVRVKAKDGKGTVKNKDFSVTVKDSALTNTSKLSASTIDLGSSVKVTCASSGGSGTKQYAVYYKKTSDTSWTKVRDYATGTSVSVTPKSATTYTVRVKAKDEKGTVVNKDLALKVVKALTAKATASATSVSLGTSVTITGSSANASGTVQYEISYLKIGTSTWKTAKSYSTTAKTTIKFPSTGNYSVKVNAKDSTGKVATAYVAVTVK